MAARSHLSMYTYLCKIFLHLHARPRTVLALAVLITLGAFFPLRKLERRMSITDLMPQEFSSVKTWRQIGEKFGGLGHLAIVVHSGDSARNAAAMAFLADHLESHPDVSTAPRRSSTNRTSFSTSPSRISRRSTSAWKRGSGSAKKSATR
jgi:predicted RND superfamily exporter protein